MVGRTAADGVVSLDRGRPAAPAWPQRLAARPAAVVFDCDGLLVDTEPSWEKVEEELFARRGLPYGPEQRAEYLGISVADAAAKMAATFGEPGGEPDLFDEMLVAVRLLLEREARAMPGAVELVSALVSRDVPLAVASNSPRTVVEYALGLAGLAGAFAVVVSADDVRLPKPAPEPYLAACAGLGVAPASAVAFEDSATGVAAAAAAGLVVVGVPTHPGDLAVDWQLPSLADPAVAGWLRSW
ncbi:MAG: HAD family phosphatase [Propionicimonas sp.]|nr:HAD family phosphatase [Propionicimonas sp.]